MIITITCILLLITGLVMMRTAKGLEMKEIATVVMITGVLLTNICLLFIIKVQIKKDVLYQNVLHQKEMIEYRIERMDENVVGNEMLFNDIMKFNNELRTVKKYANSPFTNWFYVSEIAAIEYIELE